MELNPPPEAAAWTGIRDPVKRLRTGLSALYEYFERTGDMFDCILPTRMGRTAMAFTSEGLLRLRNAKFARDPRPLDPQCDGVCCRSYTRAYLRHCFAVDEMLGPKLLSLHNVRYYGRLLKTIRQAIREGTLEKVTA